ncbi:hypothetical protein BGZ76_009948 [Entomortierella beljakovae]|nr:hypothetical protein BGZ76_009948 [Entomortierella beljakovae]
MTDQSLSQRSFSASPISTSTSTSTRSTESKNESSPIQPSPAQRMISACVGSLLTSFLVTPLDVVKTRLQSQTVVATPTCALPFTFSNNASAYEKLCTCCREVFFAPQTHHINQQLQATGLQGIRQNISNAIAGGISATRRQTFKLSKRNNKHSHDDHHRNHRHNHKHGHIGTTSKGCGPSIIQQHQEGTVVAMKTSKAQQQRLEQLAANCIENNHAHKAALERHFYGTWDGVKKIVRYEGASSLWRGLSPTLVMSIPATVIYFVGYDYLKDVLSEKSFAVTPDNSAFVGQSFLYEHRETLAPLVAGGFARTVAATVISPLELFRTRMQSVHTDTKGSAGLFRGVSQGIVAMVRSEGVLSLWRGLGPTLWRDVPFSAIYWVGYEDIKKRIVAWNGQHPQAVMNEFEIAFASGAFSGMIAATLTTPFDVAKTRRQVDLLQPVHTKMASLMRAIVREEGYRGLWRGLTARIAKVAPSCAIMISSYEIGKKALSEHWWGLGSPSSSPPSSSTPSGPIIGGGNNSNGGKSVDDRLVINCKATV